jgi:hypothetical protein
VTIWHVNNVTGSQSNNGLTPQTPKQFLGPLLSSVAAGDTVLLEKRTPAPTYSLTLTVPVANFTLGTYGTGERPIINHPGTAVRQAVLIDKSGATIRGLHFTGPGHMIWIQGTNTALIEDNLFRTYGGIIGGVPDLAFGGRAIQMRGSNSTVHTITIRGNEFDNTLGPTDASDHVFLEHGHGILIEQNVFTEAGNNGGDHIHIFQNAMDNIIIQDNLFNPNGSGKGHILGGGLTTGLIIRRNEFHGSNFVIGNESARYVEFYENDCYDVRGAAWSNDVRMAFAQANRFSEYVVHDNKFIRCRNPLGIISEPPGLAGRVQVTFEHNTIVDTQGTNPGWLKWTTDSAVRIENSIVRRNLIVDSQAAVNTAPNQLNNVITENWFDTTPTTGTAAVTGNAALDANFNPQTVAAQAYGDRRAIVTLPTRPPPPANTIMGTSGNDVLVGTSAADWLRGLAGGDTYICYPGMAHDEVSWFEKVSGAVDRLDVSQFGFTTFQQFQAATSIQLVPGGTYLDTPYDIAIVHFNANDSINLPGISNLVAADLIYAVSAPVSVSVPVSVSSPPAGEFLSVRDFGAIGNAIVNDQTSLQECLDAAAAQGKSVYIPAGVYNHSAMLTLAQGCKGIFGDGETSVLKATTYGQEALRVTGDGIHLELFQLRGQGGARLSTPASQKIWLDDIDGFEINNVTIRNTTTGGLFCQGSSNGHIHHNLIEDTHADSIHMVHGDAVSHDILVEHNVVRRSGDDGIACVSGTGVGGGKNYNITIRHNDVRFNTGGRGIGVIGGQDIFVHDNTVEGGTQQSGSGGAGIMIAVEPDYDTPGNDRVCIANNLVIDAGSSQNNPGQHSIHLYNGVSGLVNANIRIANNTIQSPRRGGIGLTGSFPIIVNHYNNVFIDPQPGWANFVNANTSPSTVVSTVPVAGCPIPVPDPPQTPPHVKIRRPGTGMSRGRRGGRCR